jgi:hypothetical protein
MHVRTLACAAALVSLAPAFGMPAIAQQTKSNSTLPAPAVLRVPTTYGGNASAAARAPMPQSGGQTRAQVQAMRYAAAMAFIKRYGPGKPVRLKTASQRYR